MQWERRVHLLHRLISLQHEGGPQHLVPRHDPVQRRLHEGHLQRAFESQGDGNVVGGGFRLQLRQEPHPQLRVAERRPGSGCPGTAVRRVARRRAAEQAKKFRLVQPDTLAQRLRERAARGAEHQPPVFGPQPDVQAPEFGKKRFEAQGSSISSLVEPAGATDPFPTANNGSRTSPETRSSGFRHISSSTRCRRTSSPSTVLCANNATS